MATKAQHGVKYRILPQFLREIREEAGLTQRDIGKVLKKPQSYIHNCETANRRMDITEFIQWARACGVNPRTAFSRLLKVMEE
jgi:transcriptional regulator with XRE-family HTH domain